MSGIARSVTFATPRVGTDLRASDWADGLVHADAGAIYMGVGEAAAIAATLLDGGKPAALPIAIVENASLPTMQIRYTTLRDLPAMAEAQLTGPALILLGPQFTPRGAALQWSKFARCRPELRQAFG